MTKFLIFFLALLVLSGTRARSPLSTKTWQESSNPAGSSPEESSMKDEEGCRGLGREECLMRRSMVAHTDYIYTQDLNGP